MLDLLERVQKRVASLVGSGLSSDLQSLLHRRDVASLSLLYKYYYGKYSCELANLVPPNRITVNSPMCMTKFYQSSFFAYMAALWNSLARLRSHSIQGESLQVPVAEVTCNSLHSVALAL